LRQLIERAQHGQFSICHPRLGRKRGEELMCRDVLSRQVQAGPVVREYSGGQLPIPCRLGLLDGRHRLSVFGEPLRDLAMQSGDLIGFTAPQLQLQEIGEQAVVAEPGSARVQCDHECVCGLQVL
jgi:hypothetical protein